MCLSFLHIRETKKFHLPKESFNEIKIYPGYSFGKKTCVLMGLTYSYIPTYEG
jgi:hypothetical protein